MEITLLRRFFRVTDIENKRHATIFTNSTSYYDHFLHSDLSAISFTTLSIGVSKFCFVLILGQGLAPQNR